MNSPLDHLARFFSWTTLLGTLWLAGYVLTRLLLSP